jgi:hypothetical protein
MMQPCPVWVWGGERDSEAGGERECERVSVSEREREGRRRRMGGCEGTSGGGGVSEVRMRGNERVKGQKCRERASERARERARARARQFIEADLLVPNKDRVVLRRLLPRPV